MATRPFSIDQPPAQPPEVANKLSGLGGIFQSQMDNKDPGVTPPQPQAGGNDGLQVMGEAVRRGIQQMAKNQAFAPFGERMLAQLDAGMQAAGGGSPAPPPEQGAGGPGGPPAGTPPGAPKSAEGSSGFPG